ncbi:tetratricopeptide repeat protein [candidate division TA06 bacterium]|nr:tetratricopeptide repeat protein [candidate division TA06 bacterium]
MGELTSEDPKEVALEYFQMGYEHQIKGDLEQAIALYTKSIELSPTAEAYTYRGWTFSFMGRLEEAIEECKKAIEVDPDFGNPYNDIGAYLIEKGKWDEAVSWLEKATHAKRYESYCFPHMNLGRAWEHKGFWSRAKKAYKNALETNPDYLQAVTALHKLQAKMN